MLGEGRKKDERKRIVRKKNESRKRKRKKRKNENLKRGTGRHEENENEHKPPAPPTIKIATKQVEPSNQRRSSSHFGVSNDATVGVGALPRHGLITLPSLPPTLYRTRKRS